MSFSAAADTAMASAKRRAAVRLYARTGFAESSSYDKLGLNGWKLRLSDGSFQCGLTAGAPTLNAERDKANRAQLLADLLLLAYVGTAGSTESQALFHGRLEDSSFGGFTVGIEGRDYRALLEDCDAFVRREPDHDELLASGTERELVLLAGGAFGQLYGFEADGSGTDAAFDEPTNLTRRSWKPGSIRLVRDSGPAEDPNSGGFWEVPADKWQANWSSGTVGILEDTSGNNYFLQGPLSVYLESAATGAANCDFARAVEDALEYALGSGGIGATAGMLDLEDTGYDMAGAVTWPPTRRQAATVSQFVENMLSRVSAGIRLLWDSSTATVSGDSGKFKLRSVFQKRSGQEDRRLYRGRLNFNRNVEGLCSKVVVTGEVERPVNVLANPDDYGMTIILTDLRTDSSWAPFNGANTMPDGVFADVVKNAWDGQQQKGFIIHEIPGAGFDEWHEAFKIDFGESVHWDMFRWVFPQTKNENPKARHLHDGVFWPGVHLEVSDDDSTWETMTPVFDHARRAPGTVLEAKGEELTQPKFRYVRVTLGTFKHGVSSHDDPGMGCGEIDAVRDLFFRIERAAQDSDPDGVFTFTNNAAHAITAASAGADSVGIAGDLRDDFAEGDCIVIENSTGNDGTWFIESVAFAAGTTEITVTGNLPSSTADGALRLAVSSYHPDLLTRLGGRHKTFNRDVSGEFNQYLAEDVASGEFNERVRLFQRVEWEGPFDPRLKLYDTAIATCRVTGIEVSFLLEEVEHGQNAAAPGQGGQPGKPGRLYTRVWGTNYREAGLAND